MGPWRVSLLCCLAGLGSLGCGSEPRGGVPPECRQGPAAIRAALRAAPADVTLDGTPLSACLADESNGAELADVGAAFVGAGSSLAAVATDRPHSPEATQLGYLVGAARRGVRQHRGVNYELVRRLEQETLAVSKRSPAFRRGERAGRRSG